MAKVFKQDKNMKACQCSVDVFCLFLTIIYPMKKLLPLLLVFSMKAQRDTIFKNSGDKIVCLITLVNNQNIFYDYKGSNNYISLKDVQVYSQNGKRSNASAIVQKTQLSENAPVTVKQFEYMAGCLSKSHQEFVFGATMALTGSAFAIAGAAMSQQNNTDVNVKVIGSGLLFAFIGGVVIFDSHKWIGRASFALSASSVSVSFKL